MVGDDVQVVSGQDLGVGVLLAGAGVQALIALIQALDQQPSLHEEGTIIVTLRKLRAERGGEQVWRDEEVSRYLIDSVVITGSVYTLRVIVQL